jgi:hypothetical protein
MNVYYELADCAMDETGQKYYAAYGIRKSAAIAGRYRELMWNSERVWAEDEGKIRFLKHRYSATDASVTLVDMREFFWVKLKSQTICE